MLEELVVRDLGVIEESRVELGPGLTALTGETGAGKTLLVGALALLLGGRADATMVRPGASEATVEGRFVTRDGSETTLARSVAATGRSRAWVDGRAAPVTALSERGAALVELHGQHAHRALVAPGAQRRALDQFAGVDLGPLGRARRELRAAQRAAAELGDDTQRQAQLDRVRFELGEIERAAIVDVDEEARLADEERQLADSEAHRDAALAAVALLQGDDTGGGATDAVGQARRLVADRPGLGGLAERLAAVEAEVGDIADELRHVAETTTDDPGRLEQIRARRHLLRTLCRKYGPDLAAVLDHASWLRHQVAALQSAAEAAERAAAELGRLEAAVAAEEAAVAAARRAAAPALAAAVEARLADLGLGRARFEVAVGGAGAADEVTFRFGANPGEPALPLAKVASGGELSRTMLAVRLVLSDAPPTLVFDEVDAGVGGTAAVAVGRALADLARRQQVVVVTHLPQVAAFADRQLSVRKQVECGRTRSLVVPVDGADREVELARMLSGRPESSTARRHAAELLAAARGSGCD